MIAKMNILSNDSLYIEVDDDTVWDTLCKAYTKEELHHILKEHDRHFVVFAESEKEIKVLKEKLFHMHLILFSVLFSILVISGALLWGAL